VKSRWTNTVLAQDAARIMHGSVYVDRVQYLNEKLARAQIGRLIEAMNMVFRQLEDSFKLKSERVLNARLKAECSIYK